MERTKRPSRVAWAILALSLGACGRSEQGVNDPANELPFGNVDIPAQRAQVTAETQISGWALDDRGIAQIRVYIDNHLVTTGSLNQDRPDVSKLFPRYVRGNHRHGFMLLAGFDVPGPHTIVVQAVDTNGATRDIGTISVTALDK